MPEPQQCFFESHLISDSGIPTLAAVLDPESISKHLRPALAREYGTISNVKFHILKHHPGRRCTFEIALLADNGWNYLIGKVHAANRSDVYRTMDAIRCAGFGPEDEFSIPTPVAYVPELNLLLQAKVEGPRAKQMFLTGSERERVTTSQRCAQWLAKLHTTAPLGGRRMHPIHYRPSRARWSTRIAALGEPLTRLTLQLSELLEERSRWLAQDNGVCAGHGSYNCNQIIINETQTTTFDWDSYDVADPCRDVARFLVALQRLGAKYMGSIHALDEAAAVFLDTYQILVPFKITANLSWYRALTCLQLSKYEANRPVCVFRDGIEALLNEGRKALGE